MSGDVSVWRIPLTSAPGRFGILLTAQYNLIAPNGVLGITSDILKGKWTL
jgi:hypothetical protein